MRQDLCFRYNFKISRINTYLYGVNLSVAKLIRVCIPFVLVYVQTRPFYV